MAAQFVQPRRFTVDDYRRMGCIGLLPEHGTELIDGVVVAGTRPFRFTSADFLRLAEVGVLQKEERVELLDGLIIDMNPFGPRHSSCVARVLTLLTGCAPELEIRIHDVLHLREGFDPHPDAAVYRPRPDAYRDSHPTADDALLVVEVAESSLLYDRTIKTEHYAAAGVPEFWLVDLKRDVIVVSRKPVAGQFTEAREYRHGERWHSPALAATVAVDDVLRPLRA
jgi:Uma2 family endonuclease